MNRTRGFYTSPAVLLACLLAFVPLSAAAAGAKGSLDYRNPRTEVKVEPVHAYLFTVPDEYAAGKIARRVLLSTTDVRAAIDKCETAECALDATTDAVVVELNGTPMVRWWAKLRGGQIQLSDRTDRKVVALTVDKADHVAGTLKLAFERSGSTLRGDLTFDAALVKAYARTE